MSHLLVRAGAALFAAALLLLPVAADAAGAKSESAPETRIVGVVNVNTATPEQLGLLPGVGPVRARAIVEERKRNGGFKRVEDLTQVSGIGERALERMRPHLAVEGKTTARLQR